MTGLSTSALTSAQYALAGGYTPTPDSITVRAFGNWPAAVQTEFVRSFGSGNPATVLIGQPGAQLIASLATTGDVTQTAVPTQFNVTPDLLDIDAFMTWPAEAQIFYVAVNGRGDPRSVAIGPFGAAVTASLTRDASGRSTGVDLASSAAVTAREAATLGTAPAALRPEVFFALLPDEQYAYALANRTNPQTDAQGKPLAPSVAINGAGAGGTPIQLTSNGRSFTVVVPAGTYPGFGDRLSGQASAVQGFASWPREVQRAYLETQASGPADRYPKTVVLSSDNALAFVAAPGAEVDIYGPLPAAFGQGPGQTPAGLFLGYDQKFQVAYARSRLEDLGTAPPLVFNGIGGQTLEVRLSDGPDGIVLSSPVPANLNAIPPAQLDGNLFALWPTGDKAAYFNRYATGTPRAVVIGDIGAPQISGLLTLGADGRPQLAPFPAGFELLPAGLTPATFLAWSPAARALYVQARGTLDQATGARSLTLAQPLAQGQTGQPLTVTAAVSATGALTTSSNVLRIDPSIAMTLKLDDPTENIYGSDGGLSFDPNRASAETLFPILDGSGGQTAAGAAYRIVDKPADVAAEFGKAPADLAVANFGKWNSAIQLEYLLTKGSDRTATYTQADGTSATVTVKAATIGTPPNAITAFVSASGTKVYTAEALQKTDIAKMSRADQAILSGLQAFIDIADDLGYVVGAAAQAGLKGKVDALVAVINNPASDPTLKGGDGGMSVADKKVFTDQLAILNEKIAASLVLSPKDVQDQIDAIRARFERVNCFAATMLKPVADTSNLSNVKLNDNVVLGDIYNAFIQDNAGLKTLDQLIGPIPVTTTGTSYTKEFNTPLTLRFTKFTSLGVPQMTTVVVSKITVPLTEKPSAVLSTDGNQGITQAYKTFMAQERLLLQNANSRQSLARTGLLPNTTQNLDVPNLVYLFQLYANLAGEAKIRADTEEINQTNALLKTYAVMQNLVNNTVKQFDPKDTDQKKGLIGSGTRTATAANDGFDGTNLTDEEYVVAKMFKKGSAQAGVLHPIEALKGLTRRVDDLPTERKMQSWQQFGQQLSDSVTLINQESQIRMNEINSATKAKDRNFDLANNALSKMNEIVQKIANAA